MDRLKKGLLDAFFPPFNQSVPHIEPDEVLHLGDDPALFDPARNAPPQQGDPPIRIYHDATVWPAQSVAHRDGALAFDTFIDEARVGHLDRLNALRHYPTLRQRGWVTTIDCVYPSHNYYHFLIDTLPRVWALRHPTLRHLDVTLCITRSLDAAKRSLLCSLLPSNVSIRRVHRFSRIHVDRYIHLPYLSKDRVAYRDDRVETSAGFIPQEYLDFFRHFMLGRAGDDATVTSGERIYITRRGANMRRLKNEDDVAQYLGHRGFKRIALEEYALEEQAQLFDAARVVVAQHGAALANLIYMREGSVVEIFSSPDTPQYYMQYADTVGLRYAAITRNRTWKHADVHLPLEELQQALTHIGLAAAPH
jgi:capsular polysaccharide biosynthesis protein